MSFREEDTVLTVDKGLDTERSNKRRSVSTLSLFPRETSDYKIPIVQCTPTVDPKT